MPLRGYISAVAFAAPATDDIFIAVMFVVTLLLCSCSYERSLEQPCSDRVLVVYLGGDNNLSGETYDKLSAIQTGFANFSTSGAADGGSCGGDIRVVVYRDTQGDAPALYEVAATGDLRLVESYGAENSASPEVFGRVLRTVRSRFPAHSYGLLIFSHASGWLPEGRLAAPVQPGDDALLAAAAAATINDQSRSIIMDGASEMEITDFASAIPDGMFDCIVLEACLTAGIEVAWELRDKCDYILASSAEIVSPGFTEDYKTSLGCLLSSSAASVSASGVEAFAQAVCDGVTTVWPPTDWRCSVTCSVIRTAALKPLSDFIRANCDMGRAVDVADVQRFDRGNYRLFFDFYDYYSRLLDTDAQRAQLSSLVSAAVPWRYATANFLPGLGGFAIKSHSGLTTYIRQSAYPFLNLRYDDLGWTKTIMP